MNVFLCCHCIELIIYMLFFQNVLYYQRYVHVKYKKIWVRFFSATLQRHKDRLEEHKVSITFVVMSKWRRTKFGHMCFFCSEI